MIASPAIPAATAPAGAPAPPARCPRRPAGPREDALLLINKINNMHFMVSCCLTICHILNTCQTLFLNIWKFWSTYGGLWLRFGVDQILSKSCRKDGLTLSLTALRRGPDATAFHRACCSCGRTGSAPACGWFLCELRG